MDLELTGKRAVVTGASRGIGLAVAHDLSVEGADVALIGRDGERLERAAAQLRAASSAIAGGITIGRLVTAQEVASVIVFLASPRSVSITGDPVAVGGGARGVIYY